mmetsp:Transcript_9384/g.38458  ORF Transcript_9384/g.38458 Transcript_9384/m.38458 type:complete len:344 (+) Transcript_9384:1170-2201(+)
MMIGSRRRGSIWMARVWCSSIKSMTMARWRMSSRQPLTTGAQSSLCIGAILAAREGGHPTASSTATRRSTRIATAGRSTRTILSALGTTLCVQRAAKHARRARTRSLRWIDSGSSVRRRVRRAPSVGTSKMTARAVDGGSTTDRTTAQRALPVGIRTGPARARASCARRAHSPMKRVVVPSFATSPSRGMSWRPPRRASRSPALPVRSAWAARTPSLARSARSGASNPTRPKRCVSWPVLAFSSACWVRRTKPCVPPAASLELDNPSARGARLAASSRRRAAQRASWPSRASPSRPRGVRTRLSAPLATSPGLVSPNAHRVFRGLSTTWRANLRAFWHRPEPS